MKFETGDKVKFMDQSGEGIVTRIISPSMVEVNVDGFALPYSTGDLIKVNEPASAAERMFYEGRGEYGNPQPKREEDASPKRLSDYGLEEEEQQNLSADVAQEAADNDIDRITPLRRGFVSKRPQPEGVYIGWVPLDQQFMLKGAVEFYIINYTPYTLLYSLATKSAEGYYGVDYASLPAYSKILVESVERDELDLWCEGVLQCLFIQDESPLWLQPADKGYKIKAEQISSPENYIFPVFMREKTLLTPVVNLADHQAASTLLQ